MSQYMSEGDSHSIKIKKFLEEMQQAVEQLQDMRDYARDHHYHEIEKQLNTVLKACDALQQQSKAELLNETKKTAAVDKRLTIHNQIETVKTTLANAKKIMHSDSNILLSSLRCGRFQLVYETSNNFFLPRNKLEALIYDFEIANKKEINNKLLNFFLPKTPNLTTSSAKASNKKLKNR